MKITCNIIQDMLPLYVDDVLSEDSRKMIEEHLKDCEVCREKRRNMEEDSLPSFSQASENEKNAEKEILLGIRRRIRRKRLAAVLICAACILGAAAAGNYLYYHREVYLPYEETGLRMEGDKLYSDRNWYGRIRGIVSPDQKTEFLVEVETCNVRREYPADEIPANRLVMDLGAISSGEGDTETTIPTLEKVYYLPKEYVDFSFSDDPEEAKKELKELEEKSVLLWEKSADNRGESMEEESSAVSTDPVRYYNGKTEIRTETGSWKIPAGSYADKNGYVYDASGTCIGVNETYRYVYDPDALG